MNFKQWVLKHKIVMMLAVVIAAGGIVTGVWRVQGGNGQEVTNFNPAFEEEQTRETTQAGTTAGIRIPGYSTISVEAGTTNISVDLENPQDNHVYFEISFYLPETQETIYTSKLVAPGQHLYEVALNRALEKGEYPLTIQYATYSMDETYTPKNGAEVNCTLVAQ